MHAPGGGVSSEYRVFETDEFLRTLRKLPSDARAIEKKLQQYVYPQLRVEPFFGANIKKLRGYDPAVWRYRIGRFRVFYTVEQEERIVFVLSVDARKDAYR